MPSPTRPRNHDASRITLRILIAASLIPLLQTTSLAVVTSDDYGTHIAEPGVTMYEINHDGVAQILSDGNFSCTVDTSTGAATEIGPLGINVPGLAYNPDTSTLYGVSGQTDALYTIDTATGVATQVGILGTNTSFCGLAYDAATDTLYLSNTVNDNLYSIDETTGLATLIGPLQHSQVNGLSSRNKAPSTL